MNTIIKWNIEKLDEGVYRYTIELSYRIISILHSDNLDRILAVVTNKNGAYQSRLYFNKASTNWLKYDLPGYKVEIYELV